MIILDDTSSRTLKYISTVGLQLRTLNTHHGNQTTEFVIDIDEFEMAGQGIVAFFVKLRFNFFNDCYIIKFDESVPIMALPEFFMNPYDLLSIMLVDNSKHIIDRMKKCIGLVLMQSSCLLIELKEDDSLLFKLNIIDRTMEFRNLEKNLPLEDECRNDLELLFDFPNKEK